MPGDFAAPCVQRLSGPQKELNQSHMVLNVKS